MRKILILLIAVIPLISIAQSPYKYLDKDENNKVYFQAVYDTANINKQDLLEKLKNQLKAVSGITDVRQDGDQLDFNLTDYTFNYKKYGYSSVQIPMFLLDPMSGIGRVEFKDNKYRVSIKDLISNKRQKTALRNTDAWFSNSSLSRILTRKQGRTWTKNRVCVEGTSAFEKAVYDLFVLKTENSNDNW